ncbi:hypothetical protein A3D00_00315 [Candidatus Woesebacteria bacterium RIFCSPHIGHO2_02_FULL_38_9]|uniref:Uncharacterized protein n=1 Tax=Candidatus Woesebacteria bacterium RIFCSPHIGHO2_01_FULL_39_28 TaxID=1802496 RepID=A0A1F7YDT5_9BACT|nr:MAG: hypothetical protein A2627_02605 [Candidatus Woesebacteria bacterium RIFCSPHIGHO2_01_FULL_39_28]OGM33113.1 MAG: hypothetical protein A3D00_00315 [Candidatus Woesebacteria bacterium RIFCSPHIGHO2_02_FULL_38_9]OGM58393.1 MAG: hypothetical protein A3A50_02530 [Candidatus Woesebacteria bacterium RIFCSPLOWO2_01_FULL_38_20]
MDEDLAHKAISAALAGNWQKAVELNEQILRNNSNDVDSLIRLARACAETGNIKQAKSLSSKALKIDPYNKIAQKQALKWRGFKKTYQTSSGSSSAQSFLEEPGKTKMVVLINLGEPKLIRQLDSGDEIALICHPHRVTLKTQSGKYIGRLPDDLSARLNKLIKLGNRYQVIIKSANNNDVKILIRETKRSEKLKDSPSFPPEKIDYVAFTPPELVHKRQDIEEIVSESD